MNLHYTVAWTFWFVVVVGGFFAIELPAIHDKRPGDTLTENLRRLFGFRPRVWWRQCLFLMLSVGGSLSLVFHLFGQI